MSRPNPPSQVRRVFLDSSSFLSLVNPKDEHHQAAKAIWTRLSQEQWHTFTTNFMVAETHALFIIRLDHRRARDFLREIVQSSTVILRVSPRDEEQGRAIVLQYDDKDFSLTDATSFAVMERLRIPFAFTFDRHFAQYGLSVLS
jgi:uncharacterized protein